MAVIFNCYLWFFIVVYNRARGKSYVPLPDVINDVILEVTISYHYQLRQRCNSERNQNLSLSTMNKADDGYIQLPAENIEVVCNCYL
jgi:hypothetical protein